MRSCHGRIHFLWLDIYTVIYLHLFTLFWKWRTCDRDRKHQCASSMLCLNGTSMGCLCERIFTAKGRMLKRLLRASFSWSTQSPMHITLLRYFRPHFSLCMRLFITSHIIRKTQWDALHTCMPQRQLRCICMSRPLVIFGQQLILNATTSCCHVPAVIAQSNRWSLYMQKQMRMIVCICVLGGCQLLQLYPAHFGHITHWQLFLHTSP